MKKNRLRIKKLHSTPPMSPTESKLQMAKPDCLISIKRLWPALQKWGKRVSLVSSVMALILLAVPKVVIQPSVNINPTETFGTQFAVSNQGNVPVLDVVFSCVVDGTGRVTISNVMISKPAVDILWPGRTTTQNCSMAVTDMSATVNVEVSYRWPIYFIRSTAQTYFRGLHGSAGYFLVPDVDPKKQ